MSLDTLGRESAERLHDSTTTGLDGAERFLELERTRTRRTRMRVESAAIAAACLVAAGWLTLQSHEGSASELPRRTRARDLGRPPRSPHRQRTHRGQPGLPLRSNRSPDG